MIGDTMMIQPSDVDLAAFDFIELHLPGTISKTGHRLGGLAIYSNIPNVKADNWFAEENP